MSQPRALVLNAPGINCNLETAYALELAGAQTEQVHISQFIGGKKDLFTSRILALSGGFSYGDDIQSGRILGLEMRTQLAEELNRFVSMGGLIIGICNGFQVLTETGLLPTGQITPGASKPFSLVHNASGMFEDRWTHLRVEPNRSFVQPDTVGEVIELPNAHAEGRVAASTKTLFDLVDKGQIVFRYANADGLTTEEYPDNPNGSPYGITGVCDETGQIVGMMPHPERFVEYSQHPNWRRMKGIVAQGLPIFEAMVKAA